ncbi:prenyltransferase/squalene oxidase repeat-containing protein [Methanolobus chelungpuianus]|uniref:Prenyltransferase alpha-alpha toroid domain-containing protein n=1 Tax=Methanolobus chelungpuianus TaxID=502115 RepID=A0AAE3H848_9EURY|nr:hypothetical protein [Methanolobus chelungpuianus]MCQ6961816.1 hypothetical protein [Methanolobus chelungpuianus]
MKDVKDFVLGLYSKDGSFSYSPANRISNLYSTCFGVMCLDLINGMDTFEDKDRVSNYIQSFQDERTGYFIDNTAIPQNNASHDQEYICLQLTDFAQLALSALGKNAKYEYAFLKKYKDEEYLRKWFYGLNWKDPWLVSNLVMFILNSMIYESETENKKYIDTIISLLNRSQDPGTGYWNLGNKVTLHNQMAGAYHFIFFYTYLKIEPNHIDRIIDSTLMVQNYDGLFNYEGGGGSCDDLDAVDLLCRAAFYSDHRKAEIRDSLGFAYQALLDNQNPDGGFCWAKRNKLKLGDFSHLLNIRMLEHKPDFLLNAASKAKKIGYNISNNQFHWRYSGLETMKLKNDDSDLFSTWFRLTGIAFIETTFGEAFKKSYEWKLRKKCGLGFYNK